MASTMEHLAPLTSFWMPRHSVAIAPHSVFVPATSARSPVTSVTCKFDMRIIFQVAPSSLLVWLHQRRPTGLHAEYTKLNFNALSFTCSPRVYVPSLSPMATMASVTNTRDGKLVLQDAESRTLNQLQ